MKDQTRAYMFALLAVLIWSTVASAFKVALAHVDRFQLLFTATLTSLLVLGIILVVRGKAGLLLHQGWKGYAVSALQGLLNPFLYYLVLFSAYDMLKAQEAQSLNYTWPIVLVIVSVIFLHQRITRWGVASVVLGSLGAVVIFTHGRVWAMGGSDVQGDLLALSSALIWAIFWIMNMKDGRDPVVKLFLSFAFGSIPVGLIFLLLSHPVMPDAVGLAASVYVGLFEMGLTFLIWLAALRLSETTSGVSTLIYLTPFLSLFFIALVVGESIYLSTLVGLVLIVTGILMERLKGRAGHGKG